VEVVDIKKVPIPKIIVHPEPEVSKKSKVNTTPKEV
jgi:hypothetical protein